MKALTFHQRLLAGVLLLLSITTICLGLVGARMGTSFLRSRFEDRMAFLARYLAMNAELGILLGDQQMLERLARNLLSEQDVLQVLIEDRDGNILVRIGSEQTGNTRKAIADVTLRQQEEEQAFLETFGAARHLGKVYLVYSTKGIDQLLKRLGTRYVFVTFALAAVGLLMFSLFSRSLIAPLKALHQAAKHVAEGRLDATVKEEGLPETKELAEAFNQMLVSLAESRRALESTYQEMIQQKALAEVGHFALTVAHEVKNPLGIIQGALDILKKPGLDEETRSTMMGYVEDEIRRLNRIINNFMDFARPQKPRYDRIDLNALLAQTVERMKLEWEEKNVNILSDIPEQESIVRADSDMMSQTFVNILKNACEACEPSGDVRVRTRTDDGQWVAEIADNGPGMAEEVLKDAFKPFFTTKAKGTGLGLSFVARIMRIHGGEVSARANSPRGTVFELRMPCVRRK